jgi:hypothetical protein
MNTSKVYRNKKTMVINGYEFGLVEGRSDQQKSPSNLKIPKACFMGMKNWALQFCRKLKTARS